MSSITPTAPTYTSAIGDGTNNTLVMGSRTQTVTGAGGSDILQTNLRITDLTTQDKPTVSTIEEIDLLANPLGVGNVLRLDATIGTVNIEGDWGDSVELTGTWM